MNIFPTTFGEFLRHTGAGCFVRSRAVGYDCAILWYLAEMFLDFISRHAKSIRQFLIRLSPRRRIPCVNKCELFATIKTLSYFIRSDSRCFHITSLYLTLFNRIICAICRILWQSRAAMLKKISLAVLGLTIATLGARIVAW